MRIARLEKNIVVELLPESTHELGATHWYGEEFAKQCVEAPDDIVQGMMFDSATNTFYTPEPLIVGEMKTPEQRILELEQDRKSVV